MDVPLVPVPPERPSPRADADVDDDDDDFLVKGAAVLYQQKDGTWTPATLLAVHPDPEGKEPWYTIRRTEAENDTQTNRGRLGRPSRVATVPTRGALGTRPIRDHKLGTISQTVAHMLTREMKDAETQTGTSTGRQDANRKSKARREARERAANKRSCHS